MKKNKHKCGCLDCSLKEQRVPAVPSLEQMESMTLEEIRDGMIKMRQRDAVSLDHHRKLVTTMFPKDIPTRTGIPMRILEVTLTAALAIAGFVIGWTLVH